MAGKNLHLVITDEMVQKWKRLAPLKGRKFYFREMQSKYNGTCCITGLPVVAGTMIGFCKVSDDRGEFSLVAPVVEIEKQMALNLPAQGYQSTTPSGFRIPENRISAAQREATRIFLDTLKHIIMEARAGSGKTTMLKHFASYRTREKYVYLAFNRKNAREGKKKLPTGVPSLTTHSFGGGIIRNNVNQLPQEPDPSKNFQIMEELFPGLNNKDRRRIRKATFKLIELSKNFGCRPGDTDRITAVMNKYQFDLEEQQDYETAVYLTNEVLTLSVPGKKYGCMYDYTDMLWWPVVMDMSFPKYDVVLADEVQDFCECQIQMMARLADGGARIVIVGDPYQAIYRFRGADAAAFKRLCAMLDTHERGAGRVLLPTNYRSGKNIVAYARDNTHVKDIEAAENAIDGEVRVDLTYDEILDLLTAEGV